MLLAVRMIVNSRLAPRVDILIVPRLKQEIQVPSPVSSVINYYLVTVRTVVKLSRGNAPKNKNKRHCPRMMILV
jgi:hypothetical protein